MTVSSMRIVYLNLCLAVGQILAPFFSDITGLGVPLSQQTTQNAQFYPEVPAGYAFSIWSVIFLYALLYALQGLRRRKQDQPVFQNLGGLTAGILAGSIVWMLLDQLLGSGLHLVPVIMLMWLLSLMALFQARKMKGASEKSSRPSQFLGWVVLPMLGLYSGWLTVAMFLNIAIEARAWVLSLFPLDPMGFALLPIIPAMLIGGWLLVKTRGNIAAGFAILWALAGIIVTNLRHFPEGYILQVAIAGFILQAALLYFSKRSAVV